MEEPARKAKVLPHKKKNGRYKARTDVGEWGRPGNMIQRGHSASCTINKIVHLLPQSAYSSCSTCFEPAIRRFYH